VKGVSENKELVVVACLVVALVVGGSIWAGWGADMWRFHKARSLVAEQMRYPDPVFRKLRMGNDSYSVCGEVSSGGAMFRRFYAGEAYSRVDPDPSNGRIPEMVDHSFWKEYWAVCSDRP
jgi:hypothetical protein